MKEQIFTIIVRVLLPKKSECDIRKELEGSILESGNVLGNIEVIMANEPTEIKDAWIVGLRNDPTGTSIAILQATDEKAALQLYSDEFKIPVEELKVTRFEPDIDKL